MVGRSQRRSEVERARADLHPEFTQFAGGAGAATDSRKVLDARRRRTLKTHERNQFAMEFGEPGLVPTRGSEPSSAGPRCREYLRVLRAESREAVSRGENRLQARPVSLSMCLCRVLACRTTSQALAIDDDSGKRFWRQSDIAGFAYGACQVAGGFAVGHISGALLNPAVVIAFEGVNIFSNHFRGRVLLYIVWETLGALLATGTFMVTNAHLYLHDPEEAAQAASSA